MPVCDEELSSIITTLPHPCILDIGCGTGDHLSQLSENNSNHFSIGIDINKHYVQSALFQATEPKQQQFIQASAVHLPFRSDSFDLSLMVGVLSIIHPDSHLETLRNVLRCIKSGGTLFISDAMKIENDPHWQQSYEEGLDLFDTKNTLIVRHISTNQTKFIAAHFDIDMLTWIIETFGMMNSKLTYHSVESQVNAGQFFPAFTLLAQKP